MKKRITRRTVSVVLIGGVLTVAATTAQAGWLFVLAAGVFALVVGSFFVRTDLSRAEVTVRVAREARAGDEVRYLLELTNPGRRPLPVLRLEDEHPAFRPVAVVAEPLVPKATGRIELVRRAAVRGHHVTGGAIITTGAPFGFTRARRAVDFPAEISVFPRVFEIGSFPILEPASFPAESLHERARTGAGQDYLGVREYRRGDPLRYIHWRSTARAGQLVVREYEEPAQSRVLLVLAGMDAGEPPDSAFEALVSACASVAAYSLHTGHPVDIVRAGFRGPERIGDVDARGALGWLAGAEAHDSELHPLLTAGLSRLGRRGTVAFFVPTSGDAFRQLPDAISTVQSVGARAIVVAADSSTWSSRTKKHSLDPLTSGRSFVRILRRGEEPARCLQG